MQIYLYLWYLLVCDPGQSIWDKQIHEEEDGNLCRSYPHGNSSECQGIVLRN